MLDHIDDVAPVSENDLECLKEIRDVLARHNMLNRFGLTLAHKHFDLADDEVLVENTDEGSRTQEIIVKKKDDIVGDRISTQFMFVEDSRVVVSTMECIQVTNGHYTN